MGNKGISRWYRRLKHDIVFVWHLLKDLFLGTRELKVSTFHRRQSLKRAFVSLQRQNSKKVTSLSTLLKRAREYLREPSLRKAKKLGIRIKSIWQMKDTLNGKETKLNMGHSILGYIESWERPKVVTEWAANTLARTLLNNCYENLRLSSGRIFRTDTKENYQIGYSSAPRAMHATIED